MPIKGNVDLDKAKEILNTDLKKVYFGGLGVIVKGTPVDSGRARNNWFLTVGRPFDLSSGRSGGSGSASLSSIQSNMPKTVLGKKLYFTNNLPYITTLEYGGYPKNPKSRGDNEPLTENGFSLQAPDGWVRKALRRMQRIIANL